MKKDDLALEIAAMKSSHETDNFADSVVRTAEIYKDLTGKDMGIESLKKTRDKVNKVPWYKRLFL